MAPGGVMVATVRGVGPGGGARVAVLGLVPGLLRARTAPGPAPVPHLILAPSPYRLDPAPALICWVPVEHVASKTGPETHHGVHRK